MTLAGHDYFKSLQILPDLEQPAYMQNSLTKYDCFMIK